MKKAKWDSLPPVADFLSPYSTLGNVLAFIGGLGFAILMGIETVSEKTGVPTTALVAVLVSIFVLCIIQFMAAMIRPAPAAEPKPAAHQKKD